MARINLLFWLLKRTQYDDFAADFDATRTRPWEEFEEFSPLLHGKVLDAGCGNGRLCGFLNEKNVEYCGVDASKKLISAAQKNCPKGNFSVGKMEKLSFKNHTFDAVAAIASIPHLPTKKARRRAFSEFFRVLKPGGNLVITAWNLSQDRFAGASAHAKQRAKWLFWWDRNDLVIPFGTEKIPRLYFKFSETDLRAYARKAGFENISVNNSGKNLVLTAQKPRKKSILNIPIDALSFSEAISKMHTENGFWTTPNPEILVESAHNPEYAAILKTADYAAPDGIGLLWAADFSFRFQGKKPKTWQMIGSLLLFFLRKKSAFFPERVTGSDLFRAFCEQTQEPVFLLGGAKGAAQKCAESFGKNFGWDDGSRKEFDEERICQKINESGARILFVAFGAPWQELWIARNRSKLPNIRLYMGVGGSFDFVAGNQKRAPEIFQKLGMEWLFRLVREPRIRGRRIFTALFTFPRLLLVALRKS